MSDIYQPDEVEALKHRHVLMDTRDVIDKLIRTCEVLGEGLRNEAMKNVFSGISKKKLEVKVTS